MKLKQFFPIAEAVSALFYPFAEVVIHDLKTGRIAAIYNNLSKRSPGDESLIEEAKDLSALPDVFPLYFKSNWDGKNMKAATATLRDEKGAPIGLFCINLDLSKWEEMHQFILQMLEGFVSKQKPALLFKDDWKEKINAYVSAYLKKEGVAFQALTAEKKKELVHALHQEGAFKAKNAASYIADVLDLSRATIYNYLRGKS